MADAISITQAFVNKVEPPAKGRTAYRDNKLRGFNLVVTAAGTKSFYLYRWVNAKPEKVFLGHHPIMTVEVARAAAITVHAEQVAGTNHNKEKKAKRAAGITLGHAWEKYKTQHLDARCAESTIVTHANRWETCLASWSDRKLHSILSEEVIALHAQLGKQRGRITANRAVQLLRAVFNYAISTLKVKVVNPAVDVEPFHETPRERFLRADEMPAFLEAVRAEPDPMLRDFFLMALFTGARRSNVQSMAWADIDLNAQTWTIPASQFKTKRSMIVVLSPEALAVLRDRQQALRINRFVFPSFGKTGHIVEPKTAWKRILERAKIDDLTIHDLRRTLGSWQAANGSSLPVIGKSLGHTQPATTAIYSRLELDAVRESVAKATAALLAAGEKKLDQPPKNNNGDSQPPASEC